MLSVFGDESADGEQQRVFVVAGLLGDTDQWDALGERWRELLGGRIFHAAECESGQGEFRNIPTSEERQHLHRDLTRILAGSGILGWGTAIDISAARRIFPKSHPDQPYLSCFLRVIHHFAAQANRCIPRDDFEFTFDQRPRTQYNSELLYAYLTAHWRNDLSFLPKQLRFAARQSHIGIQAADLWAREMMKRFDSHLRDDRSSPRDQWNILRSTNRFCGDFICSGYFEDLESRYPAIAADLGMLPDGYRAWLCRKRRQDSQSMRISYMMEVDAAERTVKTNEAS